MMDRFVLINSKLWQLLFESLITVVNWHAKALLLRNELGHFPTGEPTKRAASVAIIRSSFCQESRNLSSIGLYSNIIRDHWKFAIGN